MMFKPKTLAFAVLLLAGCGGASSSSSLEGSSGTVALTFSEASGFNGTTTALTTYTTLNGSANGNSISVSLDNGTRTLETFLFASSLAQGSTVDLSGSTGSSILYTDSAGEWAATSGTVTVVSRSNLSIQLSFTNVVLTNASSGSTGTIRVNGTITLVAG